MNHIEVGGYVIEVDAQATARVYATGTVHGPEDCACWYCRNWIAGREALVPGSVREVLARLGIPHGCETEVWEVPGGTGAHGYGGWWTFIGRVVSRPQDDARDFNLPPMQLSFSDGASYSLPEFSGHHVAELHFFVDDVGTLIEPMDHGTP